MPRVLVTGGAGYIGSVLAARLCALGHSVTVVDNLTTGHRAALDGACRFVEADLADRRALQAVFSEQKFDGVMHFASHCLVGESVAQPRKYFEDNVGNGLNLFAAMVDFGVGAVVLSSTCAVYGNPQWIPLTEEHPRQPINPYGETKLILEKALHAYGDAYGLRSVSLRYFNACGASLDGTLGESHDPETHLIPLALRAVADGSGELIIYGDDYETPDGTCVRDYIHVEDLASAHIAALARLLGGANSGTYNLGTGEGLSVQEIVLAVERITGRSVRRGVGARRPGDQPVLVANASLTRKELGWVPQHSDVDTVIRTAWDWFQNPRY